MNDEQRTMNWERRMMNAERWTMNDERWTMNYKRQRTVRERRRTQKERVRVKNDIFTVFILLQRSQSFCPVTVTVPSPSRHHPVTVPSLGVLNRPTSLSVLNRPKPSLRVLRTNNAKGRLRTLMDVRRFRTPRDGTVTGRGRTGTDGDGRGRTGTDGTVIEQKRWLRCIQLIYMIWFLNDFFGLVKSIPHRNLSVPFRYPLQF